MGILDSFAEDFKELPEENLIIPIGVYNAVFEDYIEHDSSDEEYPRIELVFRLTDNPGITFANGQPVDGSSISYALFLPREEEKHEPSRFARGLTRWQERLRTIKRVMMTLGADPNGIPSQELEAVKGKAFVQLHIDHRTTDDGDVFERVKKITS